VLGLAAVAATNPIKQSDMAGADPAVAEAAVEEVPPPLPRENAVLVFGGTGKLGRRIVEKVGDHIISTLKAEACAHLGDV
jgi:hypothetical protein